MKLNNRRLPQKNPPRIILRDGWLFQFEILTCLVDMPLSWCSQSECWNILFLCLHHLSCCFIKICGVIYHLRNIYTYLCQLRCFFGRFYLFSYDYVLVVTLESCHAFTIWQFTGYVCNVNRIHAFSISIKIEFDFVTVRCQIRQDTRDLEDAGNSGIINEKVIALGGIIPQFIPQLRAWNFGGAAFLGDVWNRRHEYNWKEYLTDIRQRLTPRGAKNTLNGSNVW